MDLYGLYKLSHNLAYLFQTFGAYPNSQNFENVVILTLEINKSFLIWFQIFFVSDVMSDVACCQTGINNPSIPLYTTHSEEDRISVKHSNDSHISPGGASHAASSQPWPYSPFGVCCTCLCGC